MPTPNMSNVSLNGGSTNIGSTANMNTGTSNIQDVVNKAITESPDLIAALECVAAMYGIPSTNILVDDSLKSIRVVNDRIIAPRRTDVSANAKSIICAIGGVLDFISQRIDEKLTDYQNENIRHGRIVESIATNADPSKGTVVSRFEDDDGDEILAYNTGLVDMPNTPTGRAKVAILREKKMIPDYDPNAVKALSDCGYFTNEEDDITKDIDMNATSTDTTTDTSTSDMGTTNDVAENIQESAMFVDLYDEFHGSRFMGYDLMQNHGFSFVKPIEAFIQESGDGKKDNKKKKEIKASDIKHMKFDNTNIKKAAKLFNEALKHCMNIDDEEDSSSNKRKLKISDYEVFINDKSFKEAINCLNKQFDASINIRYIETNSSKNRNLYTMIWTDLKRRLTISKSKGFQLGGLPIDIFVWDDMLTHLSPDNPELFGQRVCGLLCHEIFHNIAAVMRSNDVVNSQILEVTLSAASAAKTGKQRRIIITNYVNTLDTNFDGKAFSKSDKKKLIKKLCIIASIKNNMRKLETKSKEKDAKKKDGTYNKDDARKKKADKYVNDMIRQYKMNVAAIKGTTIGSSIISVLCAAAAISSCFVPEIIPIGAAGFFGVASLLHGFNAISEIVEQRKYDKSTLYEEYYCDLFAAMYQLPVTFFVGWSSSKYTPNEVDTKKLNQLAKAERDLFRSAKIAYPSDLERTHAGVRAAKNLLNSDIEMDSATKKYCQWIVDNFSSVLKTDIHEMYNKTTFDPKEAEDLDEHLEKLINDNNVVMTESFREWMSDDYIISE